MSSALQRFHHSHQRKRNNTEYWIGQLYATADPAERVAALGQLLERFELEVASAWLVGDPNRARNLEGQAEAFAVWREVELGVLAPEARRPAPVAR
ncbi:hypothetical protein BAY61_31820 (plasmid) [Prauserella marina]|uniref:Uncharacterized protein n=2 Tax=Prauserella marina TaxID=530584 RepID=A0A222W0Z4_9PSEU|nr:hypothetical protein BAY61_31820 [Prauserella marina]PWV71370.1 hypothetical protein DES30_11286 [Prauserella marina]SDD95611.1 hypothetical protein SAMN05421630_11526 [Prauserella marina]